VELFGRNLLERGLETLAEFGLAGKRRDAAVGIDADPGIEIGRSRKTAGRFWRRRRRRLVLRRSLGQRKGDDQRAAAGEQASAIEDQGAVHRAPPWPEGTCALFSKFVLHRSQLLLRTSKSQGHKQIYNSSAAFHLKFLNRIRHLRRRNFKWAALAPRCPSD